MSPSDRTIFIFYYFKRWLQSSGLNRPSSGQIFI